MISKFLAAGAIVAMMVTAAVAQNTNNTNNVNNTKASDNANQTASAKNEWQASKLIGINVYNPQNEKIGDIKELLLDQSGKVVDVAISVGGFLGMGSHDVAVKFDQLKWVNEPARSTTSSNDTANKPATTGANQSAKDTSKRTYPDHAVLNANKDQLKTMPQFDYNK